MTEVVSAAPSMRADGPLFILLNQGSGSGDSDAARQTIAAVLDEAGRRHVFVPIPDARRIGEVARDGVARARDAGGVVVAAGGDGTINSVAHAVLGQGVPFGVLPMGTFNYFGRTHDIPETLADAVRVLLDGRIRPVQVGAVNERIFLVNASLGLYPQLLEERETAKRQFGRHRLVAFVSAFYTLLRQHRVLRLWLECGDEVERLATPTLFVGNNRLQLEQIGIPGAACVEHGQLAAIALHAVSPLGLLGLALRGSLGRLGEADNVIGFGFREMTVRVGRHQGNGDGPRIKVAIDGEVTRMRLPLHFRVASEPLPLLCPAPAAVAAASGVSATPDDGGRDGR